MTQKSMSDRTSDRPSQTKWTPRRAEAQTQQQLGRTQGWEGPHRRWWCPLNGWIYTSGVYRGINTAESSLPHRRDPKGQVNLF